MKTTSLHRRLIIILLGLTLFSWLIAVIVTAINAHYLIRQQIDQQLIEYADVSQYTLNMILGDEAIAQYFEARNPTLFQRNNLVRIPGYGSQGQKQAINIWYQGKQVLVGENTPQFPEPEAQGFYDAQLTQQGQLIPWRILYRHDPAQQTWLAIGINLGLVQSITTTTFSRLMLPLLVILPVSIVVLLIGIHRGLLPLNHLAEKIASRKINDLEAIEPDGVPRELSPLVSSLNKLLTRVNEMLTSEQRFTANAAHELQTPLTAINAEVQRCQREVDNENARLMLDRISARVTRAIVTVRQLLTLARLDPDQEIAFELLDLEQLLLEVVAEQGAQAVNRQLEFNIVGPSSAAMVKGNPDWLMILVKNLVANALNYAKSPGIIEIELTTNEKNVALSIANDCAPISAEEMAQLTQRFYRVANNSHPGSGLGLSIVQRILELHDAKLELSHWREDQGFRAMVTFNLA